MPGVADLLPKDFFGKRTRKVRESKYKGQQETEKDGRFKTKGYQETERDHHFKINQEQKVDGIANKTIKTGGHAVLWSWDKMKQVVYIFIKIVLVFFALPAVFFDLAGLFGLGTLGK